MFSLSMQASKSIDFFKVDRVNWMLPRSRQLFRFREIRFRQGSHARHVLARDDSIIASPSRTGSRRRYTFEAFDISRPVGSSKRIDSVRIADPPSARVGTRWSLRDCGYWQWQQAPQEAWLGTARTEDPDLLTRTRADSRSKKRSETVIFR